MTIAIASGKGGTGKTTVSVNLAALLASEGERVRLLDCDVEEPNCRLFFDAGSTTTEAVMLEKPVCDSSACAQCGACIEACHFNAIAPAKEGVLIFEELCHACGACFHACADGALKIRHVAVGEVRISHEPIMLVDGLLKVGEPSGGALIRAVRRHASSEAITIIDAAPGTACAVVEAIHEVDSLVLVTEPTPFGLHDLALAVELAVELRLGVGVIVNRSIGRDAIIDDFCRKRGIPVIGRIPFRREFASVISKGRLPIEEFPEFREILSSIADRIFAAPFLVPAREPSRAKSSVDAGVDSRPTKMETASDTAMREIVVLSGKGGTGKTTVTAAFAALSRGMAFADTDVDAPNLHLLMKPRIMSDEGFSGGGRAVVNVNRCTGCGACARECRFQAIVMEGSDDDMTVRVPIISSTACEGCGLCVMICDARALSMAPVEAGRVFGSETPFGPLAHARLHAGGANSGKLATRVRKAGRTLAVNADRETVLIDGPPGIGCPAIASLTGAEETVIVTEPTVSGVHDLKRSLRLANRFGVKAQVIINKEDLNPEKAAEIRSEVEKLGAEVLGGIPYDAAVFDAISAGKTVIEHGEGPASRAIMKLWQKLRNSDQKGDLLDMKIAIPVSEGRLCPHFGHCDEFCLIEVDKEKKAVGAAKMVTPPPHEPGLLPRWLNEQGVNLVIAGGMGQRAQTLFQQNSIEVVVGAPVVEPLQLVRTWLDGSLVSGENACDH